MTIDQIAEAVAKMTPGSLTVDQFGSVRDTAGRELPVCGVIMPCGYVPREHIGNANRDAIVAMRNNAEALLECARLLRIARHCVDLVVEENKANWGDRLMHKQQHAIDLLARIDAALARLA